MCSVVSDYSSVNKMTAENLATCIAPNLIRSKDPLSTLLVFFFFTYQNDFCIFLRLLKEMESFPLCLQK